MEKPFGEIPIMKKENLKQLKEVLKEYKFKTLLKQKFTKIKSTNLQFLSRQYELENTRGETIFLSFFIYPKKLVFSFYNSQESLSLDKLLLFLYYRKPLGEK